MAVLTVTAVVQEATTGSNLGSSYSMQPTAVNELELTNRETYLVDDQTESSFLFTPVVQPAILVINCLSVANDGVGDSTKPLHWGYSTGVYQHELYIGESSVIRLRQGGPVVQLFMISSDTTTPTHFWVQSQVWNQ